MDYEKRDMLSGMSAEQQSRLSENPDLRKKLRIERMKKQKMGQKSQVSQIENPRQPDWVKTQSLREIEVIRESKKKDIVSRVLGVDEEAAGDVITVVPGELAFLPPIPVTNTSPHPQFYTVKIQDPDRMHLGTKDEL